MGQVLHGSATTTEAVRRKCLVSDSGCAQRGSPGQPARTPQSHWLEDLVAENQRAIDAPNILCVSKFIDFKVITNGNRIYQLLQGCFIFDFTHAQRVGTAASEHVVDNPG